MEDNTLLIEKLSAEFEIDKAGNDIEKFLGLLKEEIKYLLLNDMEKLSFVLYRIDVPERLTEKAFESEDMDTIAASITQLIYNRQLEKLKTRGNSPPKDFIDL